MGGHRRAAHAAPNDAGSDVPASRLTLIATFVGPTLLLLVVLGGWLAVRGYFAWRELSAAKAQVSSLQQAILDGTDPAQTAQQLKVLGRHTASAHGSTHDLVWAAVSDIPLLGHSFKAVQTAADASDAVARRVLPQLNAGLAPLNPLRHGLAGSTVPLPPFAQAAGPLTAAAGQLDRAVAVANSAPRSLVPGPVGRVDRELQTRLGSLQKKLRAAADVATLAPPLLGGSGPRTYFVGFVNPAELRGGGGLLGGYALVRADHGSITVEKIGSDADLPNVPAPPSGISADFDARYGGFGAETTWTVSNPSPHFPYDAQNWALMYAAATGTHVDGVLSLDPAALAALLQGAPPVTVDGVQVSSATIVDFIQRTEYDLPLTPVQRKDVLKTVGSAAVQTVTSGGHRLSSGLLTALGDAALHGHLRFASSQPGEEAVIANYPVAGVIPDGGGPFLTAFVNNAAAGKLDAYLSLAVKYQLLSCSSSGRQVRVSAVLTNNAPRSGLPAYVTDRLDGVVGAVPGQNRDLLSLMLTTGAQLRSATLNGAPIGTTPGAGGSDQPYLDPSTERGHPVLSTFLDLAPGRSATLELTLTEPRSRAAAVLLAQPMARSQQLTASGSC